MIRIVNDSSTNFRDMKICPACGNYCEVDHKYCCNCGTFLIFHIQLEQEKPPKDDKLLFLVKFLFLYALLFLAAMMFHIIRLQFFQM